MRVLLVTQYFFPENFKSNDIAFELSKRGYKVTVLTGIPNYPSGKFFKGYGLFRRRIETINGVKVYRSFLIPRGNGSGMALALNYFSFAFFASFYAFILAIFQRFDCIIVHEPSPITQGIPAIILKKIQRIPIYFWVLDLWPESLTSSGGVTNRQILSFFERLVRFTYKNSDKILISSRGFEKSILQKGDFLKKIIYFPNWSESDIDESSELTIPILADGFRIMFAGNIGESQDFEAIMQATLLMKNNKDVKWIFVGDGRKKPWVEQFIKDNELHETVFALGIYPYETMPTFFKNADALLVTLKDEMIFNLTVPAKLQAYMAASRPILAMLNGEGAEIIKDADCGYSVGSGDYENLVKIIKEKVLPYKADFESKGSSGYKYFNQHFQKNACIDNLCNIINC